MTREQWQAIKNRDSRYDGMFFYGTKNGRTFCRPSCTSKSCKPHEAVLFESIEQALQAGYHPCRLCRPDLPEWKGAKYELSERAKQYIAEHYREKFSLDHIAESLFVNKIYLSKCFKEITGTTLLKYSNQVRCEEAAKLLNETDLSIEVIGNRVGFATQSHFAHIFKSIYDCTPSEHRRRYLDSLDD